MLKKYLKNENDLKIENDFCKIGERVSRSSANEFILMQKYHMFCCPSSPST